MALATIVISAAALWAEQSHLLAAGDTALGRMQAFVDGDRQVGLATTTQRWFVIDCRNATIRAYSGGLSSTLRNDLAQSCLRGALRIVENAPSSSFAWFGAAHASLALQDWDGMNRYLEKSHDTGSREGWIARYRAELGVDNVSRLSPDNLTGFQGDLKLLAGNMPIYATFLAQQYIRRPEIRDFVTEAVELQQPSDQQRFLSTLGRLTSAGRS